MARSNGLTAVYYELPPDPKQLQDLISYRDMNAQMGEIFRACYRYGQVDHSDKLRDINKILFYAKAEKERLIKYGMQDHDGEVTPSKQTKEFLEELTESNIQDEREKLRAASVNRFFSEPIPKAPKKPTCSVCDEIITGAAFYLGNEPRCIQHK